MKISENGLKFVKQFEGLKLIPYKDTRGIPTIGYGTTFYDDKIPVKLTDPQITADKALTMLETALNHLGDELEPLIKIDLNQNQIDALLDFSYNLGIRAISKSTLLKLLNNGDFEGTSKEFNKWDHSAGRILPGLAKRREFERQLFLSTNIL